MFCLTCDIIHLRIRVHKSELTPPDWQSSAKLLMSAVSKIKPWLCLEKHQYVIPGLQGRTCGETGFALIQELSKMHLNEPLQV